MKLLRIRVWRWQEIAMLKWSCILIGMIAGAYLAEFVTRHVRWFALVATLLAVGTAVRYFAEDQP